MFRIVRSLGYALEGLKHALIHERNLQLFVLGYAAVLVCATTLSLERWEWTALMVSGGAFIAVELFNTALERLTDAVDSLPRESANVLLHHSMKAAKDVAAAAALAGLAVVAMTVLLVALPHLFPLGRP
ncbi:MAG: diacylglycerol kinase [Candidatus Peregrinibacteria bacterium Greene0416_62]|nr:MAG: diacylglycerol kinase [Candidatus Peregrinibacteria bacterium Greene0416_62]TSD00670.1 MAG: diacylglycerol kinase [Candidatus Peregrinibacteria bacterium Greene1014_49]